VDAVSGAGTLDRHEVAVRQAALASSILVSKTDLAKPEDVAELLERLAAINPRASLASVRNGEADPAALFPDRSSAVFGDLTGWQSKPLAASGHHHHRGDSHHDRVSSVALRLTEPISLRAFGGWLDGAIATYGDDLLRIKGILNVKGRERPVVVHGVQRVFHPVVELEGWPDEDRSSRLILILYDIEPRILVRSLGRALSLGNDALHIVEDAVHVHRAH
jgi:G3E family GTPase